MTIQERYEAYIAECEKTDGDRYGAILREHTEREQELYDAWQAAIRECTVWTDGETTWKVLSRYTDVDLEMWHCRIVTQGKPDEIADCFAAYVRKMAQPVDEANEGR